MLELIVHDEHLVPAALEDGREHCEPEVGESPSHSSRFALNRRILFPPSVMVSP